MFLIYNMTTRTALVKIVFVADWLSAVIEIAPYTLSPACCCAITDISVGLKATLHSS